MIMFENINSKTRKCIIPQLALYVTTIVIHSVPRITIASVSNCSLFPKSFTNSFCFKNILLLQTVLPIFCPWLVSPNTKFISQLFMSSSGMMLAQFITLCILPRKTPETNTFWYTLFPELPLLQSVFVLSSLYLLPTRFASENILPPQTVLPIISLLFGKTTDVVAKIPGKNRLYSLKNLQYPNHTNVIIEI